MFRQILTILVIATALASIYARNPCETMRCMKGTTCQVKFIDTCKSTECLAGVGVCVSDQKLGECPLPNLLANDTINNECIGDQDCMDEYKCCPGTKYNTCTKPCLKMMCKCMANTTLTYIHNSKGCPVCTCTPMKNKSETNLDACMQEKIVGPCRGQIKRYYFNSVSQKCKSFNYGGCGGNENNFLSKSFCEKKCNPLNNKLIITKNKTMDKCFQPKIVGNCRAFMPRFFYNAESNMCEEFTYGGCNGNENNFETKEQCNTECSNLMRSIAIEENPVNKCLLDKQTGPCRAFLKRHFFNKISKKCEEFIYGGCKGNENNFNTEEDCINECSSLKEHKSELSSEKCQLKKETGFCMAYIERFYFDTDAQKCMPFIYGGCQGNANNFETIEECESSCKPTMKINKLLDDKSTDKCTLPQVTGPCKAYFPMFFYNSTSKMCEEFIYGGCLGNENKFNTLGECNQQCSSSNVKSETINVCSLKKETGPCFASFERFYFDEQTKSCMKFTYGGCQGNGNNFETLEECQKSCAKHNDVKDVCSLEKDIGPCKASIDRYFFNAKTNKCEQFFFGGCLGNENNFETEIACNNKCGAKAKNIEILIPENDLCSLPMKIGPCKALLTRYYFNTASNTCEEFNYGGCDANENNFETQEQCAKACNKFKTVANKLTLSSDVCALEKVEGPCKALIERYYFNKNGVCEKFNYGGCNGNENNFETLNECESKCAKIIN